MEKELTEPEWINNIIRLDNNVEIAFWCKVLNCTKENLIFAISRIGHSPKRVNYFLQLNRLQNPDLVSNNLNNSI